MPFAILNNAEAATFPSQSYPDSGDFDILATGYQGSGVLAGCAVTAQGTPDMTLAVAAGVVSSLGTQLTVTAGNVTIGANASGMDRIDLVVISSAGTKTVRAGTAATVPTFPDLAAGDVPLYMVWVPNGVSAITNGHLVDKRIVIWPLAVQPNELINGGFNVNQEFPGAQTVNTDDTYFWDQWVHLTEAGGDTQVSNETTTVPDGAPHAARLTVLVANRKGGILQPLTNRRSIPLLKNATGRVSLQFKARQIVGTSISALKAAVLTWSGTADVITRDVVSTWGADGVTPTFATNWTMENTPSALAINNSAFTLFKLEDIPLDTASGKNVAVFIWIDDRVNAVNDAVLIGDVKLEAGPVCTEYVGRSREEEIPDCLYFYGKTFEYATAPAQAAGTPGSLSYEAPNTGVLISGVPYDYPTMRVPPTITTYNIMAANAKWRNASAGTDSGDPVTVHIGASGMNLANTQVAGDGIGNVLSIHAVRNARL